MNPEWGMSEGSITKLRGSSSGDVFWIDGRTIRESDGYVCHADAKIYQQYRRHICMPNLGVQIRCPTTGWVYQTSHTFCWMVKASQSFSNSQKKNAQLRWSISINPESLNSAPEYDGLLSKREY